MSLNTFGTRICCSTLYANIISINSQVTQITRKSRNTLHRPWRKRHENPSQIWAPRLSRDLAGVFPVIPVRLNGLLAQVPLWAGQSDHHGGGVWLHHPALRDNLPVSHGQGPTVSDRGSGRDETGEGLRHILHLGRVTHKKCKTWTKLWGQHWYKILFLKLNRALKRTISPI